MSGAETSKPVCFKIRNLKKNYNKRDSVPTLNIEKLDIYQGETTAIIGYSAAGKSTLLNLLGMLEELPDVNNRGDNSKSTIKYMQQNRTFEYSSLSNRDKLNLRRWHFGFVFQDHHLISHVTAGRNIMMPLEIKDISRAKQHSILETMAREAGLQENDFAPLRSLPHRLSGGQALRVSVLRAMAHSPHVLFADEPTGSLDPVTGSKIMGMIDSWQRADSGSRTVVLVSHNFHQAWDYCDRFVFLKSGEVYYDGKKDIDIHSPEELFAKMK